MGGKLGPQLSAEYGFDYFFGNDLGVDNPVFFNAKVGYHEKVLSPTAPAVAWDSSMLAPIRA